MTMSDVICCSASYHKNPGRLHPIMANTDEAQLERGTFFRLQVYERVEISLVEGYERAGKSVILVGKKAQNSYQVHFMAVKKSRKHSGFVI